MFLTQIFYNIKKFWDYLVYPSKHYAKKYAKKYVDEYSKNNELNNIIETNDCGSDNCSCEYYSYNSFS